MGVDHAQLLPSEYAGPRPSGTTMHRPIELSSDGEGGETTRAPAKRKRKTAAAAENEQQPKKRKSKANVEEEQLPKKRKAKASVDDEQPAKKSKGEKMPKEVVEKRLRGFRAKAPQSYLTLLSRAQSQPMFVIERRHSGTPTDPEETIEIAGSTGNLYTVVIGREPTCICPYARKGNQCKHIVYVLHHTLKAPENLQYQLAFLTTELQTILANAPPLASETVDPSSIEDTNGVRKPIEDDCPICCVEFDTSPGSTDEIVYCKAACGNNVHKGCFQQWAAQKKAAHAKVTCPFCRTEWEMDKETMGAIDRAKGTVTAEGYVNIAGQVGLSGMRDTSTYHSFWVRAERKRGGLRDEDPEYYEY